MKKFAILLCLGFILDLSANIINIPADQPTIQAGINTAAEGDTVLVQPDTYYENLIWPEVNGIKLFGSGQDNTIIDGNQQANVIYLEYDIIDTTTVMQNLTIQNGNTIFTGSYSQRSGGGICCVESSPKLINVKIQNNTTVTGGNAGGIFAQFSSMVLINVTISNNVADQHCGGIWLYQSDAILNNVTIKENSSTNSGGGIFCWDSNPIINNTLIHNNTGQYGAGIHFVEDCNPELINVTITDNNGVGIYCKSNSHPVLTNSIIYGNSGNEVEFFEDNAPNFFTSSYSDIEGGINGIVTNNNGSINWLSGNINEDPLFIDIGNMIYNLTENSPCIDAGNPTSPFDPDGTIADMGAIFFDQRYPQADFFSDIVSGIPTLTIQFFDQSNTGCNGVQITDWFWDFGDNNFSLLQHPTHIYQETGIYTVMLTITDNEGFSDTEIKTDYINVFENNPPGNFSLLSPINYEEINTLQPILDWEDSIDPDINDEVIYDIYIGTELLNIEVYNVGSESSFQIPVQLNDDTMYYWKVIAYDTHEGYTGNTGGYQIFIVNTINNPPNNFELITPTEYSVEVNLTPLFYWEHAYDPDIGDTLSYLLYFDTDSLFSSTVPYETEQNNIIPNDPLLDNSTYYWKVIAFDEEGLRESIESDTWLFWTNTDLEPPNPFDLIYPENGISGLSTTPEFAWNMALDNDPNDYAIYNLYISQDSTFTEIDYLIEGISDSLFILQAELDNNSQYYWKVIAIDTDNLFTYSDIWMFIVGNLTSANENYLPITYLSKNYPNPFNPSTTIEFSIQNYSKVELIIYNSKGQKIKTLLQNELTNGTHSVVWNGDDDKGKYVSSGVYYYKLIVNDKVEAVKKCLLLK